MPKNLLFQNYEALKLASFSGCPVTKISKSANMENFDTVGKSIKNVTKNAEKRMPENVSVQNVEIAKYEKLTVGKSIKNVTKNAEKPMPKIYLPNVMRR